MTESEEDGIGVLTTLARAGIACPPTGVPFAEIATHGRWHWGTTEGLPPRDLYMFDVDLVIQRLVNDGPAFVLCHAGHGTNSYGLNLVTCTGPVAVFVPHHYLGIYADPVHDLVAINTTYSKLHVLLAAAAKVADPFRWLMVYSNFRGICGLIDLDEILRGAPAGAVLAASASESELFSSVAATFSGAFFGAGRICW